MAARWELICEPAKSEPSIDFLILEEDLLAMAAPASTRVSVAPALKATAPAAAGVQRQCECGQHTLSGECNDCKQKKMLLQRSANGRFSSPVVPPVVQKVLAESGYSLDASVRDQVQTYFSRNFSRVSTANTRGSLPQVTALELGPTDDEFEHDARKHADGFTKRSWWAAAAAPRPQFDFSQVRVHTGPVAADAALAVNAKAFTVGQHVVFGAGQYSPRSAEGRGLIVHELTHVLQQQQNQTAGLRVQRASAIIEVGRFLRNVFLFIPYLLGLDIPFSDDELQEYLKTINKNDQIEGGFFSDDRARAVVMKWKAGDPGFRLGLNTKKLLIMEMLDGTVTDGDRQGILDLLEDMASEGTDQLGQILGPGKVELKDLNQAMKKEPHSGRFNIILLQSFSLPTDSLALKILKDMRDVKDQKQFDFENLREMRDEIFKRLRVSQLMQESQRDNAFDYPENMTPDCPGYVAGTAGYIQNARVNLAARDYWTSVIPDPTLIYYFDLTPLGKDNAYDALLKLFTSQQRVCDRTLIHCDYLVNVVEFRAYAETIGRDEFDKKVKSGAIAMVLSYSGFPKPGTVDWRKSPKAFAYQNVVPASKEDLVIGDHVTFWNHLAYDGLNVAKMQPWRLENAVLVDKDERGKDLFEGHGTSPPIVNEHEMLEQLADGYNPFAQEALDLTKAVDGGDQSKLAKLDADYHAVSKRDDKWIVTDPGIYGDTVRRGRTYDLRTVDKSHLEDDPLLIGLRDPHDPSKMGPVERPIESAPGPAPRP